MIDHATAIGAQNAGPDAGYKSWQSAVGKTVMRLDPEARTAGPIPMFGSMVHDNVAAANAYAASANGAAGRAAEISYDAPDDGFSFGDVIDMINPLHHLPVIGTLYRKLTGDTIKPVSDIIGGAIFGGPVGAVGSTVNAVVRSTTGKDIAENAFALAGFDVTPKNRKPAIAYERAAALSSGHDMAFANLIQDISSGGAGYALTADGRRNFAAKTLSTESWNA